VKKDLQQGGSGWASEGVLERAVVDQLKQLQANGRPRLLADLTDRFEADARQQLEVLRGAVAQADAHALERTAHRLKGASRTLGALGVAELCQQLELLGRAGSTQPAPALIDALEPALAQALAALRAET
jgi:HPt (histidine-containing phosphotransfer) domain-containing protein